MHDGDPGMTWIGTVAVGLGVLFVGLLLWTVWLFRRADRAAAAYALDVLREAGGELSALGLKERIALQAGVSPWGLTTALRNMALDGELQRVVVDGRVRYRVPPADAPAVRSDLYASIEASEAADAPAVAIPRRAAAPKRQCATCRHWDHTTGQETIARHAPFAAAAQVIPPWRMGRKVLRDKDGHELPIMEQGIPPELLRTRWDDFGACYTHGELRSRVDHCDRWEPPVPDEVDEVRA